jgi:SET domain
MYKLTTDAEGKWVRESDDVVTQQLVYNYCFGHPQSSLLFFPSGSVAALINHSDTPNAKIIWSRHPNHQKVWLELDPKVLLDEEHMYMGLLFEIVALRDIAPGEEIFIDYGPEWQVAYAQHVQMWNSKVASGEIPETWPLRAIDMNAQYHVSLDNGNSVVAKQPFPTESERQAATRNGQAPYPDNVLLMAFLLVEDSNTAGTMEDPKVWSLEDRDEAFNSDNLFEVSILERSSIPSENENDRDDRANASYVYTIQWNSTADASTIVKQVPHDAFVFIDKAGTSDQYFMESKYAFRHYIGIPDEIFPQGPWRNLQ